METLLRRVVLVGLFALPFIALFISNFLFFPFITGKNFAFRIIVEIIFVAWVYLALMSEKYRARFSLLLASFAAFIGVMAFATLFSENPEKSFWSNFERMEGYITLLHLFAYFVVAGSILSLAKLWERFFNVSIGVSLLVAGYGYLQLFGLVKIMQSSVRVEATLGNSSYLAIYMIFHIFLAAILLARRFENKGLRYLYIGTILIETVILYHTATRGAILGFLGGALLSAALIALFERRRPLLRNSAAGAIAVVVLLVGGFFAVRDASFVAESPVLSRFSEITLGESGVNARLVVWGMAWEGAKERPLFGWGQESFNFVFNKQYDPRLYAQEQWFDRVHNVFFDWLIAGGFLGLFAYLSLFAAALWYLWFHKRAEPAFTIEERALFTGLLGAYFFHNLFVFDNIVSYLLFATVLSYLHHRTAGWKAPLFTASIDHGTLTRVAAPALSILLFFSLYFFNWSGLASAYTLLQALKPYGNIAVNTQLFEKALAYDSFGTQEAREQLIALTPGVLGSTVDPAAKQAFAGLALSEIEKQVNERPGDARSMMFLGTLLDTTGQSDRAVTVLTSAIPLSPRKQQLYLALGSAYLNKGDTEKALSNIRHAFELAEENEDARLAYATALVYAREWAAAEKLLVEGFGTAIVPDDRLLRAYVTTKQFGKAIAIAEARVAASPANAQYRVSLAGFYVDAGRRTDAIAALRKAIELDPSFKSQGEYYIGEIEAGRNP